MESNRYYHLVNSSFESGNKMKKGKKTVCLMCNMLFYQYPSRHRKYCSAVCYWLSKKYNVKGKNNPMYGKQHSDLTRMKIAKKRIGSKASMITRSNMSLQRGGTGIPYEITEYGAEFDNALKEQVRMRDGYKCKICGCSQLENNRQLDVHHKDYNKQNNLLTNLISLCTICHRKTNWNRKYWFNYFKKGTQCKNLLS